MRRAARLAVVVFAVFGAGGAVRSAAADDATFELSSPAFAAGADIPRDFTCEGADRPPPLAWRGAPPGTRSFALIVDDPDAPDPAAPKMTWVHWVLYAIPPDATRLDGTALPAGTVAGTSDFRRTRYGGPCPPVGIHRYFFKLYALDSALPALGAADKATLEAAMRGHVLTQATLLGRYRKTGN